jgi:hypothetical protein
MPLREFMPQSPDEHGSEIGTVGGGNRNACQSFTDDAKIRLSERANRNASKQGG